MKFTSITNKNDINVAKALTTLDKELVDLGLGYDEIVESRGHLIGVNLEAYNLYQYYNKPGYEDCKNAEEILDKILQDTYVKIIHQDNKVIENLIKSWKEYDSYDTFETNIKYENVNNITQSKIYNALNTVLKYAREQKFHKETVQQLMDFLTKMKTHGVAAINLGYQVGNKYYEYLDSDKFGIISNDVFTVGNVISSTNASVFEEYKGYNYVFHKDIGKRGAPEIALAAFFKNADNGDVQIDIKLARNGYVTESDRYVGIIGYIKDIKSIIVKADTPVDTVAKQIAEIFNESAPKMYKLADNYPSLYTLKKFRTPLEEIKENLITEDYDQER